MYTIQKIILNRVGQIELHISSSEGDIVILFENGELLKVKDERDKKNNMLRDYLEDETIHELIENLKVLSHDLDFMIKMATYPDIWIMEKSDNRVFFKFEHSYLPFVYDEDNLSIYCKMYGIEIKVDDAIHENKKTKLIQKLENSKSI